MVMHVVILNHKQTNGGTMLDHQAEMWAVLCEPPEQFNDLISHFDTVEFKKKFNRTSFTWNTIDPDVVICKFRIACIEYAVASARKVQPTILPDYWQTIEDACQQVIDALNGNGDLDAAYAATDAAYAAADAAADAADAAVNAARAAANAARAAAYAARAAAYAAYAAANAARAAAYAADAAARAAADAARAAAADAAAYAANDARAAARADLSEIFINIILSEYENKC